MQDVLRRAGRFARAAAPVLITGESGTGKELLARSLHASSDRAAKPFVVVNVAALPGEILESELFGHSRGAFTGAHQNHRGLFEAGDGGTLFLDEIGEMAPGLQAKLLRVLQDGEVRRVGETHTRTVDVRLVSATHRDLTAMVARGTFREDLFYRLSVLTLRLPPLRERREDILPLARQLVAGNAATARPLTFTPAAEAAILAHGWPGNVRELDNAMRHGAALAPADVIEREHLPETLWAPRPTRNGHLGTLAEAEREHILAVLAACGGSMVEAARVLDIGRNTLWRKLKSWA